MNFAVMGFGAMGKNHAKIYSELGVLSAVYDTDERQRATAEALGYKFFSNIEDFFSLGHDAVSIVTPTQYHVSNAIMAVNHGCHVLVEKPIASDIESAKDLILHCRTNNKILTVGYIERYNPAYLGLKRLIGDGSIGDIRSIGIKRVGGEPRSADNVVVDLMTHDFSLLLDILKKKPIKTLSNRTVNGGKVDCAQVLIDFGDCTATCESNWVSPVKIRTIQVTGSNGYCEVDMINKEICLYKKPGALNGSVFSSKSESYRFSSDSLKSELILFLQAVRSGDSSMLVTGEDALDALQMTLEAAYD